MLVLKELLVLDKISGDRRYLTKVINTRLINEYQIKIVSLLILMLMSDLVIIKISTIKDFPVLRGCSDEKNYPA